MKRNGVSPVIATILMVAITVVRAAVLYVMVSGYMSGESGMMPVAGSLTLDGSSTPSTGDATLRLGITAPDAPREENLIVKIFDSDDNLVVELNGANATANNTLVWKHVATNSGDDVYKSGDKLTIDFWDALQGYKVVLQVDGYSGTVEYVFL